MELRCMQCRGFGSESELGQKKGRRGYRLQALYAQMHALTPTANCQVGSTLYRFLCLPLGPTLCCIPQAAHLSYLGQATGAQCTHQTRECQRHARCSAALPHCHTGWRPPLHRRCRPTLLAWTLPPHPTPLAWTLPPHPLHGRCRPARPPLHGRCRFFTSGSTRAPSHLLFLASL